MQIQLKSLIHMYTHLQQGCLVFGLLVCVAGCVDCGGSVLRLSLCLLRQEEATGSPLSQDGAKEKVLEREGGREEWREGMREREG